MELKYLDEIETIAICFNNLKETAFILFRHNNKKNIIQPNNLSLIEQDIHSKIIKKRFKLLQESECEITNMHFEKYPNNSYEGYCLYFWQESEKLFLIYPFGYILIYDYNSGDLLYHFQCTIGKHIKIPKMKIKIQNLIGKFFALQNIIGSPIENCLFITCENSHSIYCLDYSILNEGNDKLNDKVYNLFSNKINIHRDTKIYDIIVHPNQKFFYVGFSDGIVRVYDYNDTKNIKELTNTLVEYCDNKNDNYSINNNDIDPVLCLDINNIGSYLLEGKESGNIYLWDAFLANKNKKIMYKKEMIENGIFSLKFIKTKQFENTQKFICLSKKGNIIIYFIIAKDDSVNQPEGRKIPLIEAVYKKNIFDNLIVPNSILKYNINLNSFLNISYNNNIILISWPKFVEIDNEKKSNKNESTLIYSGLISKIFFFFNDVYPKMNYPLATQLRNRLYEEYIPIEGQPYFENKIYYADNYFVYLYDISTSCHRKLINYSKEYRAKNLYLIKFDVKDMITHVIFFILIETQLHRNNLIIFEFDFEKNNYLTPKIIYNINDFVILGNSHLNKDNDYAFLLGRDMVTGFILQISTGNLEKINIGKNIIRTYHSPFNHGYCIIFRTIKNEFKFTQNFSPEIEYSNNDENKEQFNLFNYNLLNFKCSDLVCFKIEENEKIIDILFNIKSNNYFCIITMLDKINIYNREMKLISSLKFNFKESPYIVSSLFFLDSTLIYSKNDSISYFYPKDNINQLIFRNNRKPIYISGILPDRFIIVSQTAKSNISLSDITSPMINPLEPILIGYLDSPNINYDLVKQCVINMFTNQISHYLIDKLISKNLKEISWLFINDDKSSFQNMNIKLNLINESYNFENIIENILINKNIKNKLDLDDIIWKLKYDKNNEYIKDLLIKELKILIEFGQYNSALKILELLGDYPVAINLLLISTSYDDFEKLKIKFESKEALNFTDDLLINNIFNFSKNENNNENSDDNMNNIFNSNSLVITNSNEDKMEHYHKIFDNYEGEHFTFGAYFDEFKVSNIDNFQEKIEEKNPNQKGPDAGIQKRIINFGEKPFNIYSNYYNISKKQNKIIEIYSLVLQKIEDYYGIIKHLSKNEKEKMKRKMSFYNYNLTLNQVNKIQNNLDNKEDFNIETDSKHNLTFIKDDDFDDDDMNFNEFMDDIPEDLYLNAYYHCDRGNGEILEDVTQNKNNAIIKCIYNNNDKNIKIEKKVKRDKKGENNEEDDMKNVWSEVLDENRPLEYEDKWGRRSPPAHSIIFTKILKTKIIINNSNFLQNFSDKFTIELWIKLKENNNINIFSKEAFSFDIDKGQFKLAFHGQEFPQIIIKEYILNLEEFMHICFLYKKSSKNIIILLNCEEIIKYNNITLSGIENNSPLIFGNENFEGEMTEIRIWNQKIPINFLKENYKAPLPILAENKGKLQMNINMKAKKPKRNDSIFVFGEHCKSKTFVIKDNISSFNNKNNLLNFNLEKKNNDFEVIEKNLNEEEYPTLDLVNSQSEDLMENININQITKSQMFYQEKDFKFDD